MARLHHLGAAATASLIVAATAVGARPATAVHAAGCPLGLSASAQVSPAGGTPFTVCSGHVPSFDGTPLDVDVSIPDSATGPLPLMVLMHGWGNSKTEWESTTLAGDGGDKYHWNNAWFASKGWAVLTYSARGFAGSCGKTGGQPNYLGNACQGRASWTHLSDRRWETHDTQYLAGLLADAGVADPQRVAASGGSYGGGQSWLLALSQDQVMNPDGTLSPWTSPNGTPMHLVAAVPHYPWTDLVQALMDNGHASDGLHGAPADGDHTNPIGVEKESYVDGLYADGEATAQYAPPGQDPTADLTTWYGAISAGEPYQANPNAQSALSQIRDYRSPFYMPVPAAGHQVPVFDIQGLTDPLFPGIQATDMVRHLLAAQPGYPVWATFGDIGHSYADNPHAEWQTVNTAANAWLRAVMAGTAPKQPRVTWFTTACESGQTVVRYTAATIGGAERHTLRYRSTTAQMLSSSSGGGQEGAKSDPIANSGCRTMTATTDPGVASWTITPPSALTLLGAPVVHLTATATGGPDIELAARLWDLDTAGNQTLVSRAVYRFATAQPASFGFELWPNAWQVQAGHTLKLELTEVDSPTWRQDNEASTIAVSALSVTLPTT